MSKRNMFHPLVLRLMLTAFIVLFVSSNILLSQQKKTAKQRLNVAVMDFDARGGITKEDAASLSDAFQAELVETNEFTVVDRNRIKSILQEQGFQQSEACSQVECLVEAGKILKVEKMFAGTIGKVGRIYTVNIQLIDVATAEIVQNKSKQHSGDIEELLTDIVPKIAAEMASSLTGKDIEAKVSSGGSSWYWYVGGAAVLGGGAAAYLMSQKKSGGTTTTPQNEQLPPSPDFP